ncbi:MAG: hypothetical protein ACFFAU_18535 [Candidatus Hodarchaeota archaeon]
MALKFEEVFTPEFIDSVVSQVEKLGKYQAGSNADFFQEKLAVNLFKLGIKLHNDDLVNQAKASFTKLSLIDQLKGYSNIVTYYLENPFFSDQSGGERYLQKALQVWKESLKNRDVQKVPMSSYDYFNHDLRLLESSIKCKNTAAIQEVKQGCLEFIAKCPRNIQPLLLVSLAKTLSKVEEKPQLLEYLKKADTIVNDSSQIQYKAIETDLERNSMKFLMPQMAQSMGSSLFELQLTLAEATQDVSILESLLRSFQNMEMMHFPFSSIPQLLIAKTFYKLGDRTKAISLFQEVLDDLLTGSKEILKEIPQAEMFSPLIASRFAAMCLELNEKDLARKVIPVLTKPVKDKRLFFLGMQKNLLIELGAYTKEDLRKDLIDIKIRVETLKVKKPLRVNEVPMTFLAGVLPEEADLSTKLAELKMCADSLDAKDLQETIATLEKSLMEKISKAKGWKGPKDNYLRDQKPKITPDMIIEAFNTGKLTQVDTLLTEYELTIHQLIDEQSKQATSRQSPSTGFNLPPGGTFGNIELNRLLILSSLARLYIEVKKVDKASAILKEIKSYLKANEEALNTVIKTAQPAFPILQLFRNYNTLMLDIGCSDATINEIIKNYQKYDPEGLVGFGISLANAGFVQQALEINKQKIGTQVKGDTWNQYFDRKAKFLSTLGEYEEMEKAVKSSSKPISPAQEAWRSDAPVIVQSLYQEDHANIKHLIEKGVKNLTEYNYHSPYPPYTTFVNPLIKDHPPQGIKPTIWHFARDYLKNQFILQVSEFKPGTKSVLSYPILSTILLYLVRLNAESFVKKTSLQILNTIQEAIKSLAPDEVILDIEFSSSDVKSWDFDSFLGLTLKRTNLHFVITRDDYWTYYKATGKAGPLTYEQFHYTYQKWISEYNAGEKTKMHLYINIPFVYSSLCEIFTALEENTLIHLCQRAINTLQKSRWNQVQNAPIDGQINQESISMAFSNILTPAELDLSIALKTQNYVEGKMILTRVFELLEHDLINVTSSSEDLSLNPVLMSVLNMFGLLSKY